MKTKTTMKIKMLIRERCSLLTSTCLIIGLMTGFVSSTFGQNLKAHWTLDELNGPTYADSSTNLCTLYQDPNTAAALVEPGLVGNSQWLNWQPVPGTSTRLFATNSALQNDSFGFSFWIQPVYLNDYDNFMLKEEAYDPNSPSYAQQSWQVHMIGNNGSGAAPIEFIVRGTGGQFYGVVTSITNLTLYTGSTNWIHVAGGYDAVGGTLTIYVNGQMNQSVGIPGADNSDGSPLSIGTAKNGPNNYVAFAAGVYIDDVQMYDSPLSTNDVAFIEAYPGSVLNSINIQSFNYSSVSGTANLTFSSESTQGYTVRASTSLTGSYLPVTSITATSVSTTVALSKSLLDGVFGPSPRPQLFYKVSSP